MPRSNSLAFDPRKLPGSKPWYISDTNIARFGLANDRIDNDGGLGAPRIIHDATHGTFDSIGNRSTCVEEELPVGRVPPIEA